MKSENLFNIGENSFTLSSIKQLIVFLTSLDVTLYVCVLSLFVNKQLGVRSAHYSLTTNSQLLVRANPILQIDTLPR